MKNYETPIIEIVEIKEDIVTVSVIDFYDID